MKFICWVNICPVPRCSWYSFSFQVRSEKRRGDKHKKEEVISIVAKGMLGFVSDMGSPDQCLESFENRQRDAQASALQHLLQTSLCIQTRDNLEMSQKHPFRPCEVRKTEH